MSKIARTVKPNEATPKFLLFLKNRLWRHSAEEPAKSSSVIETIVFLLCCFVVLAIVVITYQKVRGS